MFILTLFIFNFSGQGEVEEKWRMTRSDRDLPQGISYVAYAFHVFNI